MLLKISKTYFIIAINVFLFVITFKCGNSQVNQQWSQVYNFANHDDISEDMLIDSKGNVYITGSSMNNTYDFATLKYTHSGDELWTRRYSGQTAGTTNRAVALVSDTADNVYVTGKSLGFDRSSIVLMKYDPSGNEKWIKNFNIIPDTSDDQSTGAVIDNSGNLYITGWTYTLDKSTYLFIIKFNLNGDKIWTRVYTTYPVLAFSGNTFQKIIADRSGNIYAATSATINGTTSILLLKYNQDGLLESEGFYPSCSTNSMAIDNTEKIYICGIKYNTYNTAITLKFSSSCSLLWAKEYDGPPILSSRAFSTGVDGSNNVYTLGNRTGSPTFTSDLLLIKYDANGNLLWTKTYGGTANQNDAGYNMTFDSDNNIYVTGESNVHDIVTIKYDSSGNQKWITLFPGTKGLDICTDKSENIFTLGYAFQSGQGFNYVTLNYSQATGIQQTQGLLSSEFKMYQNYPNPFNPDTRIRFYIYNPGIVSLKVFDQQGKVIQTLANEFMNRGNYEAHFDGSKLSSGIYYYKIEANNFNESKMMILIK